MSEKILSSICAKMTAIIQEETLVSQTQAQKMAKKICDAVDWNNSALMHKDLRWITKRFLRTTQLT